MLSHQEMALRTSPAVQWLRLRLPMQGTRVRSLVGELGSHIPRSAAKKKRKWRWVKEDVQAEGTECAKSWKHRGCAMSKDSER